MFADVAATNSGNRAAWGLAACAVAARILCLCLWPAQAYSVDLKDWRIIAGSMLVGINPLTIDRLYQLLNWPPMWMEILSGLARISDRFDWPLMNCIRILLIAADVVLILSTWQLLRLLNVRDRAFRPVLWGLCLNPLMILLTIQQGNFDVIPTILILWFLQSLIRFRRVGDPIDWLLAAAWLGLGGFDGGDPELGLTLIGEARQLNFKTLALGAALCAGPVVLSLLPLYALYPQAITNGVLFYRGTQGNLGVIGLIQLFGGIAVVPRYRPIFTGILLIAMTVITVQLRRKPIRRDGDLVLLCALILIGLFEFGSGYCPQYWMWAAPLLCICYTQETIAFRRVLIAAGLIIVATNILVFAYNTDLGRFVIWWSPSPFNQHLSDYFTDGTHDLILLSLPMTVATLVLWLHGLRRLVANWTAPA